MGFKNTYKVAGVLFSVDFSDEFPEDFRLDNCKPFEVPEPQEPLFALKSVSCLPACGKKIPLPEPDSLYETRIDLFNCEDGSVVFEMAPNYLRPVCARLRLSKDYKTGELFLIEPSNAVFAVNNSLMLQFALCTSGLGLLVMHASVVVSGGLGYLFLGKSGTGKSTHSSLWMKNIPGTRLLNDDNPILGVKDGRVTVYGSPWSGKTPCYINDSAPVGAIVSLSQAPHNRISRQSIFEAYASIYSSCSGLKFDEANADGLHTTIEEVVTRVGCFALECLPDADAAIVCHNAVAPAVCCASGSELHLAADVSDDELMEQMASLLDEGHSVVMKPKGFSMLPYIRNGKDSVVLKKQQPQLGSVALVRLPGSRYVLHRIISLTPEGEVTLAGDGNLKGTESCTLADVLGIAVAVITPQRKEKPLEATLRWRELPYNVRRIILAIYRRLL